MNERERIKRAETLIKFIDGMLLDDAVSSLTAMLAMIIENVDKETQTQIFMFVVNALGEAVFGDIAPEDIGHVIDKTKIH